MCPLSTEMKAAPVVRSHRVDAISDVTRHQGMLVIDAEGNLAGVITRGDADVGARCRGLIWSFRRCSKLGNGRDVADAIYPDESP